MGKTRLVGNRVPMAIIVGIQPAFSPCCFVLQVPLMTEECISAPDCGQHTVH